MGLGETEMKSYESEQPASSVQEVNETGCREGRDKKIGNEEGIDAVS